MDTYSEVKNLNEAQKEYSQGKKDAQELIRKISRAILDMPAACNGNWGMVGDVNHLVNELQGISDRLYGEGEYADPISTAAAILGSMTSEKKAASSRENGSKPPKPGSNPRGRPRKSQ